MAVNSLSINALLDAAAKSVDVALRILEDETSSYQTARAMGYIAAADALARMAQARAALG